MTVNALPASITATSSYQSVTPTRQAEASRPSPQTERAPSPLPESVPSVNTQGQKIGTRISTQA